MKQGSYMDRALKARDPRFARILGKMGYQRSDLVASARSPLDHDNDGKPGGDHLAELRRLYQDKFGKRAFNGWDADAIRERLAAHVEPKAPAPKGGDED